MRKLEVKIRQIIWAIQQSFKVTTYDLVMYQGKKYYVKSSLTGEGIWNLFDTGFGVYNEAPKHERIKESELKIIHSFGRFKTVFKQHMFFQWSSWQKIDCNRPLGRRLCYYNSENIRF